MRARTIEFPSGMPAGCWGSGEERNATKCSPRGENHHSVGRTGAQQPEKVAHRKGEVIAAVDPRFFRNTVSIDLPTPLRKFAPCLRNGWIFQPWFVPRETYLSIVKLVPREYLLKMHDYFDWYGCMKCGSRSRPYDQNGMCRQCSTKISRRLRRCWKRRLKMLKQQARQHEMKHILANAKTARRLLGDMTIPALELAEPRRRKESVRNPAGELAALAR